VYASGQADTNQYPLTCEGVRELLTEYLLHVFIGQADTDQIFIERMHNRRITDQYSLGVFHRQGRY